MELMSSEMVRKKIMETEQKGVFFCSLFKISHLHIVNNNNELYNIR